MSGKPKFVLCSADNTLEDKSQKILVLGIGNYLMGDEGVGVHIVKKMEGMDLPEYLEILDGGTGGFFLMPVFDEYKTVIMIDATIDGKPAGTLRIIKPRFASDYPNALSVHDVGLRDMIEALYIQEKKPDVHLMTVSVEGIRPMIVGLTNAVEKVVDKAIEKVLSLAEQIHKGNI